jgi:hypothetical protein
MPAPGGGSAGMLLQGFRARLGEGDILIAHDLFRKPVSIPDQIEDMLFGIMR